MTMSDISGADVNDPRPRLQAFLTTDEVLGYLNTTPRTIYRLIRSGELPAVRVGGQWRFRRDALDAWVERQKQTGKHSAT